MNEYNSVEELLNDLLDGEVDGVLDASANNSEKITKSNFNQASLKNYFLHQPDFWWEFAKYMKQHNGTLQSNLKDVGGTGDEEQFSVGKYIDSKIDFYNLFDNIYNNYIKQNKDSIDLTSETGLSPEIKDYFWNESMNKLLAYFYAKIDPEGAESLEKTNTDEVLPDTNNVFEDGAIPTDGTIKNFYMKDVRRADAGFTFNAGGPWVKPQYNIDGETYKYVRGIDKIISVLANDAELQFTRSANKENENYPKYLRLLMPKYLRYVEVEDLNRNFWVIGQTISAISAYLFSDDSPLKNGLKGALDEIAQLWENVFFLWLTAAATSQKPKYTDLHVETVYLPNSEHQNYLKFDDFDKNNLIEFDENNPRFAIGANWAEIKKRIAYIKDSYPKCNICIIPEIRAFNYKHNYYSLSYFPGLYLYDRNKDEEYIVNFKSTGSESDGIIFDIYNYVDFLWAISENDYENTYEYYFPLSNMAVRTEEKDKIFYCLGQVTSEINIEYNAEQQAFVLKKLSIELIDRASELINKRINAPILICRPTEALGNDGIIINPDNYLLMYKAYPYRLSPSLVPKSSSTIESTPIEAGYYQGELLSYWKEVTVTPYNFQTKDIGLLPAFYFYKVEQSTLKYLSDAERNVDIYNNYVKNFYDALPSNMQNNDKIKMLNNQFLYAGGAIEILEAIEQEIKQRNSDKNVYIFKTFDSNNNLSFYSWSTAYASIIDKIVDQEDITVSVSLNNTQIIEDKEGEFFNGLFESIGEQLKNNQLSVDDLISFDIEGKTVEVKVTEDMLYDLADYFEKWNKINQVVLTLLGQKIRGEKDTVNLVNPSQYIEGLLNMNYYNANTGNSYIPYYNYNDAISVNVSPNTQPFNPHPFIVNPIADNENNYYIVDAQSNSRTASINRYDLDLVERAVDYWGRYYDSLGDYRTIIISMGGRPAAVGSNLPFGPDNAVFEIYNDMTVGLDKNETPLSIQLPAYTTITSMERAVAVRVPYMDNGVLKNKIISYKNYHSAYGFEDFHKKLINDLNNSTSQNYQYRGNGSMSLLGIINGSVADGYLDGDTYTTSVSGNGDKQYLLMTVDGDPLGEDNWLIVKVSFPYGAAAPDIFYTSKMVGTQVENTDIEFNIFPYCMGWSGVDIEHTYSEMNENTINNAYNDYVRDRLRRQLRYRNSLVNAGGKWYTQNTRGVDVFLNADIVNQLRVDIFAPDGSFSTTKYIRNYTGMTINGIPNVKWCKNTEQAVINDVNNIYFPYSYKYNASTGVITPGAEISREGYQVIYNSNSGKDYERYKSNGRYIPCTADDPYTPDAILNEYNLQPDDNDDNWPIVWAEGVE